MIAKCICFDYEFREKYYKLYISGLDWWLEKDGCRFDNVSLDMNDGEINDVCDYISDWWIR